MTKCNYDWNIIPYFEQWEFDDPKYPGSGDLISLNVIASMIHIRTRARVPIHTLGPTGGCVDVNGRYGHAQNSYHLKRMGCEAADFYFDPKAKIPPRAQWEIVKGSPFTGIGVYYDIEVDGELLPIAFHGDHRPKKMAQAWKREDGEYTYFLR